MTRESNAPRQIARDALDLLVIGVALIAVLLPSRHTEALAVASTRAAAPAGASKTLAKVPLSFEPNVGQTDERVKFLSRGRGYSVFLTPTEAIFTMERPGEKPDGALSNGASDLRSPVSARAQLTAESPAVAVLTVKLTGAARDPQIEGVDALPATAHYYLGNDPEKWRRNVPMYARVKYRNVYPGVDLVYHGSDQQHLEYDFVVAPGVDPDVIRLAFEGSDTLHLDGPDLVVGTGGMKLVEHAPVVYQELDGGRRSVAGDYVILDDHTVGFRIADYDRARPLIIDPTLSYLTYVGGSGEDVLNAVTTDAAGNAYVAGWTSSPSIPNFPTSILHSPPSRTYYDGIVAKYDPSGAPVFIVYFGGTLVEVFDDVAVDLQGNIWLSGIASSLNLPLVNPLQATYGGNPYDALIVELSPTGALLLSSYLGGSDDDEASAITTDSAGNAYLSGNSVSSNFPTLNAHQSAFGGHGTYANGQGCGGIANPNFLYGDAFLTKVSPGGSMIYSTYLGGSGDDIDTGVAADSSGNIYISGITTSPNFPTANAYDSTYAGATTPGCNGDSFLAKFDATGGLLFSTYIGGNDIDAATTLARDGFGNVYVGGWTTSSDFPAATRIGPLGGADGFVVKLDSSGAALVGSALIGGSALDAIWSVAVDATQAVYLEGGTNSDKDFPVWNAFQPLFNRGVAGLQDFFVTKLSSSFELLLSSYMGAPCLPFYVVGSPNGVAVDPFGSIYVALCTSANDLPTTGNAAQSAYGGGPDDGFLAKIVPGVTPSGVIVTDHFDDDSRGSLWGARQRGTGPSIDETGGKVQIDIPGTSTGGSMGADYLSTCTVSGDFDVQVNYATTAFPYGEGIGIVAYADSGLGLGSVTRFSFTPQGGTYQIFPSPNPQANSVQTSDAAGALRLRRTGATATGYYYSSGAWLPIGPPVSFPTADARIALGMGVSQALFTHETAAGTFDDVMLTAGTVHCPVNQVCGDGVLQAGVGGEECDDGNTTAGDGCCGCRAEPLAAPPDVAGGWQANITCANAVTAVLPVTLAQTPGTGAVTLTPSPAGCGTFFGDDGQIHVPTSCSTSTNVAQLCGTMAAFPAAGSAAAYETSRRAQFTPYASSLGTCGSAVTAIETDDRFVGTITADGANTAVLVDGTAEFHATRLETTGGQPCFTSGEPSFCTFQMRRNAPSTGSNVTVEPLAGVTVTFDQVTAPGQVIVTQETAPSANLPPNFQLLTGTAVFDNVTFSGAFSGSITVCVAYPDANSDGIVDGTNPPIAENAVKLLHQEGGLFVDVTSSRDPVNNRVCGRTPHLSQFVLGAGAAVCSATPLTGCHHPTRPKASALKLKNVAGKNQVTWKSSSAPDDFGDPLTATGYALCVYDRDAGTPIAVLQTTAPAGGTCGTKACWRTTRTGFKYSDKATTPDGMLVLQLKTTAAGEAKLSVKGKGPLLSVPTLPLTKAPSVTAQLVSDDGVCWDADFSIASKNEAGKFSAKSD